MRAFPKILCAASIFAVTSGEILTRNNPPFGAVNFFSHNAPAGTSMDTISILRGGAKKKKSKTSLKKSSKTVTGKKKVGDKLKDGQKYSGDFVKDIFSKIKPLTKTYIYMILICTVLGLLLGEERAQAVMVLDPMRTIYGGELWRPFTAASFLGKPSIGWLMNLFYLVQYGNQLEEEYGPAQFLVFLLSQLGVLSFLSMLARQPVFGQSVVTAMLHVLSRATPKREVKWLIINIKYALLPYAVMAADCLQAQSIAAAIPHILGILSGHFYLFHKFIWPKIGGEDWLSAPDFLIERMDPNSAKSATKDSLSKALKSRKRGKGKKLGR